MNKFKKVLISGLVISALSPSAYAKCPNNTYNTLYKLFSFNNGNISVQQLVDYLKTQCYGASCNTAETAAPTAKPTAAPTVKPTTAPTAAPTAKPTTAPTAAPTAKPTTVPTAAPTARPTTAPTAAPTAAPTVKPTAAPTTAPATNASAIEQEVFRLVNEVRAQYGLSALSWANDLANVARAHSRDMINRNFFSHTNPDGYSPFDRLRNNGISYRTAAENIAYGQRTAQAVMDAWMNSSGHRANILNANVKEIGVGAATSSSGTIYWTQLFVAR